MRRWLLNLFAAFSCCVLLATLAGWVRGYFSDASFDYVSYRKGGADLNEWLHWRITGHAGRGAILLSWARSRFVTIPPTPEEAERLGMREKRVLSFRGTGEPERPRVARSTFAFAGFGYRPDANWGSDANTLWVPYWFPAIVSAMLPALWLRHRIRRRRRRHSGQCSRCGYDLRATPDRCPECGAVAPQSGVA
jgi:hypothetical protein